MEKNKSRTLEIDDDQRQEHHEWTVQRIGQVLLLMLLVGIAFGLFGRGGPLSKVETVSNKQILHIEYDRFMRYHSPDSLRFIIEAPFDNVRVNIDRKYLAHIRIEQISPQPEREIGGDSAITYVFNTQGKTKLHAAFHISPQKYGKLNGWVSVDDGPPLPINHFVYP